MERIIGNCCVNRFLRKLVLQLSLQKNCTINVYTRDFQSNDNDIFDVNLTVSVLINCTQDCLLRFGRCFFGLFYNLNSSFTYAISSSNSSFANTICNVF